MNSNQAIRAYKASKQLNQNPRDVLTAVHEELYRAISSAKYAHEQNTLDHMCVHLGKAVQILTVLATTLNFSAVGGDGERLQRYYLRLLNLLNRNEKGSNRSLAYQQAIDLLQPLCHEFRNAR
ncbi:flagellar protein FliS [uncultured Caulobacter sp.]|uniref:flagellar protein FliS n=1 Tax=uncultured Caulobacter sp. TaxID=158749 RepID=UPI00344CDD44